MFEGQFSPTLNLALFSRELAQEQQDWPKNSVISGFLFYDKMEANQQLSQEICDFLDEGPAPIVFTLGSSAVNSPGQFYIEAIKAAKKLGTRAILLTGREGTRDIDTPLPEGIRAFDYAPYSLLFPRAAAIVHQGGVGTTAQALRAGRPQIIVPFSHDQPDNAARIVKMGAGLSIELSSFNGSHAAAKLKKLLQSGNYVSKAAEIGKLIRAENGEQKACEAIESALNVKEVTTPSLAGQPL
jgi:rhamnosyltransferase subunit B